MPELSLTPYVPGVQGAPSDSSPQQAGDVPVWDGTSYDFPTVFTSATEPLGITLGTDLSIDATLQDSVYTGKVFVCDGTGDRFASFNAEATVVGTSPAGPTDRYQGFYTTISDAANVGNWSVTGVANNGSGLIRLTVPGHEVATGDSVGVYEVTGTTEANGQWIVTKIDANTVDLQGSTFTNAWVSGGIMTNRGSFFGALFGLIPAVSRGGLTGTAQNGDDVNGVAVYNGGPGVATSAFLVAHNTEFGTDAEYYHGFTVEANATAGVSMIGTYEWGIDLYASGLPTYTSGAMVLPNDVYVYGRNAADSGFVTMFKLDSTDMVRIATTCRFTNNIFLTDGVNIDVGSSSGTKIGLSTSQKLGFYNATPIAQPSGVAVTAAGIHAALVSLGLIAA